MYAYSMREWVFLFYFYCFFGWVFESAWVSIRQRPLRWVNRGFLRGPFLPLYGSGAIMMLVVSAPFQDNVILTFLAGCVGATVLEYVTGVTMEALFKVRYWDYSNRPFNFQGHICLGCTVAWGFLTIGMTEYVHKPIEQMMYQIPGVILSIIVFVMTIFIVIDATLSFKAALDMRDVLVKMAALREEMERMQRRLDVIAALADEEKLQMKATAEMKMDELSESLELRLSALKNAITEKPGAYLENVRSEASELAAKFQVAKYRNLEMRNVKDYFMRSLIKGNPTMRSIPFKGSFEEMKNSVTDKVKKMVERN